MEEDVAVLKLLEYLQEIDDQETLGVVIYKLGFEGWPASIVIDVYERRVQAYRANEASQTNQGVQR